MAIRDTEIPLHRVLREVYRHYLEFRDLVSLPEHDGQGGYGNSDGIIKYGYDIYGDRLAELIGDKDWATVLKNFSREDLLATGDVVEYQKTSLSSGTPVFYPKENPDDPDEELEPVMVLKPIIKGSVKVTLSFWDLQGALKDLSPRKREAVFYNVILDKKQKDVAAIMGITTVSVGQYVEQAMIQLSEKYFANMEIESDEKSSGNAGNRVS